METKTINNVYDYWNERPCNIRHSSKEIGSKEFFDEVENKKHKVEPHIIKFADFSKWKNKKVLEIGCGIGTAAINFARAGAEYTGIDLTDSAIDLVKKRFDNENLKGKFYTMNAEDELPQDKYDLIYSFGVIHHTPNPKRIIENVSKLLNKDGEFRFMVYSKWSYKLFWVLKTYSDTVWNFSNKMDEAMACYSEAQTGCPISFTYTFDDIENLLSPLFTIKKIWKDHIFPYEIEPYKQGKYVISEEFKDMEEDKFNSMCKELGWHTMTIATLKK